MTKIRCVHCGHVFDLEEAEVKGGLLVESIRREERPEPSMREFKCPKPECGQWMKLKPKK
jgi:hypothetical protein